jgi:hypothetical protein
MCAGAHHRLRSAGSLALRPLNETPVVPTPEAGFSRPVCLASQAPAVRDGRRAVGVRGFAMDTNMLGTAILATAVWVGLSAMAIRGGTSDLVADSRLLWSSAKGTRHSQAMRAPSPSVPSVVFSVYPPSMRSCDPPKVAMISWDATSAGVKTVKVFAVQQSGHEVLFVHNQRRRDSWQTGAWVRADTAFVLRESDHGSRELARLIVGSESCG